MNKYNIIYIHSHDTGRYIQPFGYAVPTPNIQKLAEEGVLFRQNFCANPTCSPSRSALLTGCYPHQNGMLGLAHLGFGLKDYKTHLVHALKKNGYITALSGVQHISDDTEKEKAWQKIGYDVCLNEKNNIHTKSDAANKEVSVKDKLFNLNTAAKAVEFILEKQKKPFFLSVGFEDTHREFPFEDLAVDPKYCQPPPPLPDTPVIRLDMARFITSAKRLDENMGKVFDAVDKAGLIENTLIICTTDHGIAFPKMKCNLTDSGIGTMLIIKGPQGFENGKVIDEMTTHLDIFPTICHLLDIDKPQWLEGKSLLPLVNGEQNEIHQEIFSEINFHVCYEPQRSIRTKQWKYIKKFHSRKKPVLPNCDDSLSKNFLLENGFLEQETEEEQLYDLIFDPNEVNNLASNQKYQKIKNALVEKLHGWMLKTNDPLLKGEIKPPSGAHLNYPDRINSKEDLFTVS